MVITIKKNHQNRITFALVKIKAEKFIGLPN